MFRSLCAKKTLEENKFGHEKKGEKETRLDHVGTTVELKMLLLVSFLRTYSVFILNWEKL